MNVVLELDKNKKRRELKNLEYLLWAYLVFVFFITVFLTWVMGDVPVMMVILFFGFLVFALYMRSLNKGG